MSVSKCTKFSVDHVCARWRLQKKNYRLLHLILHSDNIFHRFLPACRSKCGCQTTFLCIIEDWKSALERHEYVTAILMDLSEAFDSLPHKLIALKLEAK